MSDLHRWGVSPIEPSSPPLTVIVTPGALTAGGGSTPALYQIAGSPPQLYDNSDATYGRITDGAFPTFAQLLAPLDTSALSGVDESWITEIVTHARYEVDLIGGPLAVNASIYSPDLANAWGTGIDNWVTKDGAIHDVAFTATDEGNLTDLRQYIVDPAAELSLETSGSTNSLVIWYEMWWEVTYVVP